MTSIAPCVMTETTEKFLESVKKFEPFAMRVHIDISDGEFAPVILIDPDQLKWPSQWTVDIHAMVMNPMDYVDKLIALKPHTIIFHAETAIDLVPVFDMIKKAGINAGLALLKSTVPETVEEEIKAADHVLIFSGDLGHFGGTASFMQIEKIRLIKNINPKVEIGWDGGVSVDNAFTLTQGGVDVLNVGGAINNADDPARVYATLLEEIKKQGVI